MTDQLPTIHIHEARLNGVFDLPPADMPYITYQGRTMLVLLADAIKISIGDTKEGDTKASWVFKAVDAAVVREESMRDHLSKTLYLDDEYQIPPLGVDLTQEAWSIQGDDALTSPTTVQKGHTRVEEEEEITPAPTPVNVDEETGEIIEVDRTEKEPAGTALFSKRVRQKSDSAVLPSGNGHSVLPTEIETYGQPVRYKDKTLAGFMEEGE